MTIKVDIKKNFGDFKLEASFMTDEKCTGILGQSGSGKSMILRCIAGIVKPDEGSIYIGDRLVFDSKSKINMPIRDRNVGFLFQNYALFPNMNVEKNILSAFKGKDKTQNEKKLKELLKLLKIENLKNLKPHQLSGGQAQRVSMARMLGMEPDIMLLDEPFSALDYSLKTELQIDLYDLIKNSQKQTLLVTHNRDEVYRFCDLVVAVDGGKTISVGGKEDIFEKPKNVPTAKLIGIKNIFEVESISGNTLRLKGVDFNFEFNSNEKPGFVGIRAHDIETGNGREKNVLEVEVLKILEEPFEKTLVLKPKNSNERIIMAMSKDIWNENYRYLDKIYIDVEKIKLLN